VVAQSSLVGVFLVLNFVCRVTGPEVLFFPEPCQQDGLDTSFFHIENLLGHGAATTGLNPDDDASSSILLMNELLQVFVLTDSFRITSLPYFSFRRVIKCRDEACPVVQVTKICQFSSQSASIS